MDSLHTPGRRVVVLLATIAGADELGRQLCRNGAVVYPVRTAQGLLRVATAIGPATIVLDDECSGRLRRLLAAHPMTAGSRVISHRTAVAEHALAAAA
jgi:hypothetical protein